jgi:hypothetical protein
MKKTLLLKRITVLFLILTGLWTISSGQVLLNENFDYPNGSLLTSNGWTAHSGAGTQAIDVIVPGLSFTGYPSSGIGGAARLDNSGEDVNRTFISQTSGSVYVAFLINVTSTTTAGDYFFHVIESPSSTYFKGRIWLKQGSTASKFYIGLAKTGTTPAVAYSANEYDAGTTYLLILKYQFNSGSTSDDVVTLYVNPNPLGTEPATPTVTASDNTTTDGASVTCVALRQGGSSSYPNLLVDGIRVATNWTDALSDLLPPSPAFDPANTATGVAINVVPSITFDEPVRKTDGSELTNADLSTLVTLKETDASGAAVAFSAAIDAAKKVITVTPSANLKNNQLYYLAVGPVEDAAGNESTLKSVTFTTISASTPTVTVVYPNGGEVLYSGDLATVTWTTTNFDAGENVKIDVWLPESVWFTIEASTPNDGSQVVTVGPKADYGTTYKIRVSGVTNGASDESDNPFTIIATSSTLEDLKTYDLGSKIRYTGEAVITFIRTANRNQKYLQDATGGLMIDDNNGVLTTTLAIGDKITGLEGTLGTFTGMFQLVPTVASVTVVSSGNTVTVPTLTIPEYTANWAQYESMLIRITNLTFPAADGSATFAAQTQYTVTDGTNNLAFFTWKAGEGNPAIVGTVIPSGTLAVTGLALKYNTTIEIASRSTSDFEILSAVEKNSATDQVKLYPVPSSSVLNISGTPNLKSVDILDAAGKLIRTINTSTEEVVRIPVGTLKRGTYMIRLNTAEGTVIKRFVKQ